MASTTQRGPRGHQRLGAPVGASDLRGLVRHQVGACEVPELRQAEREPRARVHGEYPEAVARHLPVQQLQSGFALAHAANTRPNTTK